MSDRFFSLSSDKKDWLFAQVGFFFKKSNSISFVAIVAFR